MVRTFIAIKITPKDKLLKAVLYLQKELTGEAITWVKPENQHITLKFLRDIATAQVDEIKVQLETIARKYRTFEVSLKGLSYFKTKGQPRVLFANIYDVEQLNEIVEEIESKTSILNFTKEKRNFKPHLSLARIKFLNNSCEFYQLIDRYKDEKFQDMTVSEIIFYQSRLKPNGPEYLPLHIAKFKDSLS